MWPPAYLGGHAGPPRLPLSGFPEGNHLHLPGPHRPELVVQRGAQPAARLVLAYQTAVFHHGLGRRRRPGSQGQEPHQQGRNQQLVHETALEDKFRRGFPPYEKRGGGPRLCPASGPFTHKKTPAATGETLNFPL
jgi:hypothetical protein